MADDVREFVRLAQDAEIRGDKQVAAQWLQKAGLIYRQAGKTLRADQMVRHAERLQAAQRVPVRQDTQVFDLVGQHEGLATFEDLLRRGDRKMVLVGPAGSGKSHFLRGLVQSGIDLTIVDDPTSSSIERQPDGDRLLLAFRLLSGTLEPSYFVEERGRAYPIYGLDLLSNAVGGQFPIRGFHRVDGVILFSALSRVELTAVARQLVSKREGLRVSETRLESLVDRAAVSGLGGHGLESEILQLPLGHCE